MTAFIRFLSIIMTGLMAGALFVIWIGYDPHSFSAQAYLEQQQNAIRSLNTFMPVIGLIAIILSVASAFMQKNNKRVFITLLLAAALLSVAGLVTRLGNQPINSIVMTWTPGNMPPGWVELRDKWSSLHLVRTVASFFAFCLVVFAGMRTN